MDILCDLAVAVPADKRLCVRVRSTGTNKTDSTVSEWVGLIASYQIDLPC